ncbi:MAG: cobalt-precorrin 5A hydrolase [Tyzzerella sp.]|uniref:Cobalt-precorrin 5A hydrolase n=1 Tax=Candidatus Fimicola merdigallinarum TaxID=2840819 RepID=A0A9D9H3B5_9FIRM|nr:cobalt-precorrin 5A hydrolase [Candidatus Fimicola merdigallinarum]
MKTAIFYITENGKKLSNKISENIECTVFGKEDLKDIDIHFYKYDNIIFIMAMGIVVRKIAKLIKSKKTDPAVIVCDEKGSFAISLLSGHIGGANEFAKKIADITGGIPVITTATDVNNKIAFDVFAKENDLYIKNIENMKYVSGDIVDGKNVGLFSDIDIKGEIPSYVLNNTECESNVFITPLKKDIGKRDVLLIPKKYILGIGCKRDTPFLNIKNAVYDFLSDIDVMSLKAVVSIDLKKDEKGILEFCESVGKEFKTFKAEELLNVEGDFTTSDFVLKTTGVSNVCERSIKAYNSSATIIKHKTIYKGITLALGEIDASCTF